MKDNEVMLGIIMPVIIWQSWGWGTFIWSSIPYAHGTGQHGRWMNSDVVRIRCRFEVFVPWVVCGSWMVWGLHSMGWTWELDGLKPSFHGLDVRVGQFEAFVPWVGHESWMVWGLCSMGWTWELDGLRPLFHGLDMGVRQFGVFIPWAGHGSQTVWGLHSMGWTWESDILRSGSLRSLFHGLNIWVWHSRLNPAFWNSNASIRIGVRRGYDNDKGWLK